MKSPKVNVNNQEIDDQTGSILSPTKSIVPIVGQQYMACISEDLKKIDCLTEIDDWVKQANAERKSLI